MLPVVGVMGGASVIDLRMGASHHTKKRIFGIFKINNAVFFRIRFRRKYKYDAE